MGNTKKDNRRFLSHVEMTYIHRKWREKAKKKKLKKLSKLKQ